MRILVFGASGAVGSRVVQEAVARGHQVTPVSRTASPDYVQGDASDPDDVARLSQDHDLVISATRPRPGKEGELVEAAKGLLIGLRSSGVRLILVGGAASLIVPGTELMLVESPDFPAELRPIALACNEQFDLVRASADVDWTYVSPPALLEPGSRTGTYRLGIDHLVTAEDGTSFISMEDFAHALVDEAEQAQQVRRRFTVGY
ncbi:NAD(P)-dependent oxidoreductase [Kribbella sp. NPDC049174]|uniref:NAD(P)-dependent oxidoreductase n=1 Tax=Kribbella sp. NPDC049174 TaxID=3364112 RepID=UPI00372340FF